MKLKEKRDKNCWKKVENLDIRDQSLKIKKRENLVQNHSFLTLLKI